MDNGQFLSSLQLSHLNDIFEQDQVYCSMINLTNHCCCCFTVDYVAIVCPWSFCYCCWCCSCFVTVVLIILLLKAVKERVSNLGPGKVFVGLTKFYMVIFEYFVDDRGRKKKVDLNILIECQCLRCLSSPITMFKL